MNLMELHDIILTFDLLQHALKQLKHSRQIRWKHRNFVTFDKTWYNEEVKWYLERVKRYRKDLYDDLNRYGFIELSKKMKQKVRPTYCRKNMKKVRIAEVIRKNPTTPRQITKEE